MGVGPRGDAAVGLNVMAGSFIFGNDEQAWDRYLGFPPMVLVHCDVEDSPRGTSWRTGEARHRRQQLRFPKVANIRFAHVGSDSLPDK